MIQVQVDRSVELGAARYQGLRPTCIAFTMSDLNAGAHKSGPLSVEYLCHHAARLARDWKPHLGFTVDDALTAMQQPGQPHEHLYPYQEEAADTPLNTPPSDVGHLYASPHRGRDLDYGDLVRHVADGELVGAVISVSESLYHPHDGVVRFDPMMIPDLYHGVIAAGLGRHVHTGEQHVLVRNSWGTGWGVQGHAWIPKAHLQLHLVEGFLV